MREIKFRAWNPIDKIMGDMPFTIVEALLHDADDPWLAGVENNIYLELTGLKDKNGKDIYEGDVVDDALGVGEIRFVMEHAAFMVYTRNPTCCYHRLECDGQLKLTEVIGNIYENPELLEESK